MIIGDLPTAAERVGARPHPTPTLRLVTEFASSGRHDLAVATLGRTREKSQIDHGTWTHHVLDRPRYSGSPRLFVPRVERLKRAIANFNPDLVHAQGIENEYALAAIASGVPALLTAHGIPSRVLAVTRPGILTLERVPGLVARHVLRRAKHVVTLTSWAAGALAGSTNAILYPVPNVMPRMQTPGERAVSELPREIVAAGTLYPLKGFHHIIEALILLDQQEPGGPGFHLTIYGGAFGPRQEAYKRLLQSRAERLTRSRVTIEPWTTPARVQEHMARAAYVIVSSEVENLSTVAIEALAVGTPVLASYNGGNTETVGQGGAYWVTADAGTLTSLLRNRSMHRWQSMRSSALNQSLRYMPERVIPALEIVYGQVVETPGTSR